MTRALPCEQPGIASNPTSHGQNMHSTATPLVWRLDLGA